MSTSRPQSSMQSASAAAAAERAREDGQVQILQAIQDLNAGVKRTQSSLDTIQSNQRSLSERVQELEERRAASGGAGRGGSGSGPGTGSEMSAITSSASAAAAGATPLGIATAFSASGRIGGGLYTRTDEDGALGTAAKSLTSRPASKRVGSPVNDGRKVVRRPLRTGDEAASVAVKKALECALKAEPFSNSVASKLGTHTFSTCAAAQELVLHLTPKLQASMRSATAASKQDDTSVLYSATDIDAVPALVKSKLTNMFNNYKTTHKITEEKKAEYSQVARRAGMIASFRAKALTIVRDAERKKTFMTYVAQEKTKGKLLDVDSSLVTEATITWLVQVYPYCEVMQEEQDATVLPPDPDAPAAAAAAAAAVPTAPVLKSTSKVLHSKWRAGLHASLNSKVRQVFDAIDGFGQGTGKLTADSTNCNTHAIKVYDPDFNPPYPLILFDDADFVAGANMFMTDYAGQWSKQLQEQTQAFAEIASRGHAAESTPITTSTTSAGSSPIASGTPQSKDQFDF